MFYQHDEYEQVFGNMSWGHAVSTDLLHWEELGKAISPSDDGLGMIFSGCTIVDTWNTSGFGKHTMFAFYTSTVPRQQQSMAYSKDKGRTWIKYENNPVIPNIEEAGMPFDFRDPKIMWHQEGEIWIMSLAAKDHIQFWSSPDLLNWTKESEFGQGYGVHEHVGDGAWECPDLIEMYIDSNSSNKDPDNPVWILLVSMNQGGPNGECGTQYFIGDFLKTDGKYCFKSFHKEVKWLDYGPDNYAGVTFSQLTGRAITMAWMSNWQYALEVPTYPFKGVTAIPRELQLCRKGDELVVANRPAEEVYNLKSCRITDKGDCVKNVMSVVGDISSSRIQLEAAIDGKHSLELELSNGKNESLRMGYDLSTSNIYFDRRHSGETEFKDDFADTVHIIPLVSTLDRLKMEIFIDKMTVEIFINDGLYTMSGLIFPTEPYDRYQLHTAAGVDCFDIYVVEKLYSNEMEIAVIDVQS